MLLLMGCYSETNYAVHDVSQQSEEMDYIQGYFKTNIKTKSTADKLFFLVELQNISGKDLEILHYSKMFKIIVTNDKGEVVFDSTVNKAFTLALERTILQKDEILALSDYWNLKTIDGNEVPNGKYKVTVTFEISLTDNKAIHPDELIATSELVL